jgi:hypothetical protein
MWLLATTLLGGCCTDRTEARNIRHAAMLDTRARAEPTMRAAAQRLGAELLPVLPQARFEFPFARELPGLPRPEESEDRGLQLLSDDPHVVRLHDGQGAARIALLFHHNAWYYARLARRGEKLYILLPQLTDRIVDERTQCDCYDGPTGEDPAVVFVVDDIQEVEVHEVQVPLTVEVVRWRCKLTHSSTMPGWTPPDLQPWKRP